MGFMGSLLGLCVSALFFSLRNVLGDIGAAVEGTVVVHGKGFIGKTDETFICATLDWWPPEKCDYGRCSWGHASLLNLDLKNKILLNAVKAFSTLKLRVGGSLQDIVTYENGSRNQICRAFSQNSSAMFGFNQGCLPMNRWDELNRFFSESGAVVVFGLNALAGKNLDPRGFSTGDWNPANAESLIRYTVNKNYSIHGWELGNELSGSGVGTSITADQYARDTAALNRLLRRIYKNSRSKPLVIGPGGFYYANWFEEYLNKTSRSLNVATHHIYNLGAGRDDNLVDKILDPSYLGGEASTFKAIQDMLRSTSSSAVSWVGEAGGAYNSGKYGVTNAFAFSLWYLDQLGMAAKYGTKTYCRQSLIGGNYGLLDTFSLVPNPDFYSALLWHRLMGRKVLLTSFRGTTKIRVYGHCAKNRGGIMLLLINLDGNTTVRARVVTGEPNLEREEYHLTALDGKISSRSMLLNGKMLNVSSSGEIPPLKPFAVDSSEPIEVAPHSIVFSFIPHVVHRYCI